MTDFREITFRPLSFEELGIAYALHLEAGPRWIRMWRDRPLTFDSFPTHLFAGAHACYRVDLERELVGVASVHSVSVPDRTCHVEVVLTTGEGGAPLLDLEHDVLAAFVAHVRRTWSPRKIYLEALADHRPSFGGDVHAVVEVTLRDALMCDGDLKTVEVWALWDCDHSAAPVPAG